MFLLSRLGWKDVGCRWKGCSTLTRDALASPVPRTPSASVRWASRPSRTPSLARSHAPPRLAPFWAPIFLINPGGRAVPFLLPRGATSQAFLARRDPPQGPPCFTEAYK